MELYFEIDGIRWHETHKKQMTEEVKGMYESRWQYWSLVIIIYTCLVAMGVAENVRSITFPLIKEYFNQSDDAYGFFQSCISVAYILFCLLASFTAEKISYKFIIWVGYILIIAGSFLTQIATSYFLAGLCIFIMWMGMGFFEIGSNATSTIVFVENKGTMMSLLHFFFGLGAIIGPNVARLCLKYMDNGFYSVYFCIAFIVAFFFVVTLFLPFKLPKSSTDGKDETPTMTVVQALNSPSVWLCSITMGVGNVIEASGASWAPLYLVDVLGLDINTDVPNFTTLLYIIFTISRLVSGPIIDRLGYYRSLFICFGSVLVLLLIGFALGKNGIWFFALCGFFYSANWPVFICVITGYFKKDAPVVTSIVIVLQGIVTLPTSYLLGLMNEHIGKRWAYQMTVVFCILAILLLTAVYCSQKRHEKQLPVVKSKDVENSSGVNIEVPTNVKEVEVSSGINIDLATNEKEVGNTAVTIDISSEQNTEKVVVSQE